jgi:hypothetical protein
MQQIQIKRVFLDKVEVSKERAQELYSKYVTNPLVNEAFYGGLEVVTPEGVLRADVIVVTIEE